MANVFNSVPGLHPKRNGFSAHTYRNDFTSCLGVNIPVYLQEVPPATRVRVNTSALVRLQALIAPIMDNIDFYVHFWKIPYRLLEHDRFTQFISGEISAEEYDALFITPYRLANDVLTLLPVGKEEECYNAIFGNGSIMDFCGYDANLFPTISEVEGEFVLTGGNNWKKFNFRPLLAYYMLHLNWYMNENVPYWSGFQDQVEGFIKDQDEELFAQLLVSTYTNFKQSMLPHGWEKDYFTAALPNVQFGSAVTLPLSGSAPVSIPAQTAILNPVESPVQLEGLQFTVDNGEAMDETAPVFYRTGSTNSGFLQEPGETNYIKQILGKIEGNTGDKSLQGTADLSEASAITINEFRFANALQLFKERQLRFGRRRQEYYKGFFDVEPEDLRLQLPKYLGGGRIPINIADIEQTSANSGTQVLGHLAGKATAVAGGFAGFETFCSEESVIIGIAFAMPHITYAQNVSRFRFKTNDYYDYFNPSFEHLGEQAIEKLEIYAGDDTQGEFGYTPRYNEYRFHSNEMHGAFKDSLSFWTLGRIFDNTPSLNAKFIYMQPSVFNRIFAVDDSNPMLCSMLFRTRIIQPVSKYGVPMLIA